MMGWRHLMRFFVHHPENDQSAQVDEAFRATMATQLRTAVAAEEVVDAATEHRAQVNAVRRRIVERTKTHEQRKHCGQTSEVRSVVEDVLRTMQTRGGGREPEES